MFNLVNEYLLFITYYSAGDFRCSLELIVFPLSLFSFWKYSVIDCLFLLLSLYIVVTFLLSALEFTPNQNRFFFCPFLMQLDPAC